MELLFLFASAFLGGISAWFIKLGKANMKILLGFSGAFMLGLSFFDVLPEAYGHLGNIAGIWVLGGFMLQIVLEVLSKGMEHGHAHALHDHRVPFGLFIGLGIHELVEGLPFAAHHAHDHHSLLAGVVLHKVPVAFILGTVLRSGGLKLWRSVLALFGFSIMTPLGSLTATYLENTFIASDQFLGIALSLVVGIFLHIATTIIFESDKGHAFNLTKLVAIVLGFVLAFLSV
jgi:zinc transporter ZupT